MDATWKEYQSEAAAFFRSIGLDAETDVTVNGIRTSHDIDVVVKSHHAGFDITWLVECKHWKTPVSKLHVLALREIVTDVGADRGILLAESGFQSGALEAAALTNVQLTSLARVRASAGNEILSMRMRDLYDRNESCKERYWNIPKKDRIAYKLRPDLWESSYFGAGMIEYVADVLSRAFRGIYPVTSETLLAIASPDLPRQFVCPGEIVAHLEPMVADLEARLTNCEAALAKGGQQ